MFKDFIHPSVLQTNCPISKPGAYPSISGCRQGNILDGWLGHHRDDTDSHILLKDLFLDIPGSKTLQFSAPRFQLKVKRNSFPF